MRKIREIKNSGRTINRAATLRQQGQKWKDIILNLEKTGYEVYNKKSYDPQFALLNLCQDVVDIYPDLKVVNIIPKEIRVKRNKKAFTLRKQGKGWSEIVDILESQGYPVAGKTKQGKVTGINNAVLKAYPNVKNYIKKSKTTIIKPKIEKAETKLKTKSADKKDILKALVNSDLDMESILNVMNKL